MEFVYLRQNMIDFITLPGNIREVAPNLINQSIDYNQIVSSQLVFLNFFQLSFQLFYSFLPITFTFFHKLAIFSCEKPK